MGGYAVLSLQRRGAQGPVYVQGAGVSGRRVYSRSPSRISMAHGPGVKEVLSVVRAAAAPRGTVFRAHLNIPAWSARMGVRAGTGWRDVGKEEGEELGDHLERQSCYLK